MNKFFIVAALLLMLPTAPRAEEKPADCKDALGVSRIVEIDTRGGLELGEQYPPQSILQKGEVALTFDDGPHPEFTKEILAALKAQCTKATFFNVGEMVKKFPDVAREVQAQGHTVGTHTWSHANLAALSLERAKRQIETTINAENAILAEGVAPFFRFPYLSDPKRVREYLASRNIGVFGIDVDSKDYLTRKPDKVIDNVLKGLIKTGGGIILFHDIHAATAKAMPTLLEELKRHGFRVVHLVPKARIELVAMAEAEPDKRTKPNRGRRHRRHARR
jgi:peptidoglycan-N-acetylglucosamine deacetylase